MEEVMLYVTSDGKALRVCKLDNAGMMRYRIKYDPYWASGHFLEGVYASLEEVTGAVMNFDQTAILVTDLGDMTLYVDSLQNPKWVCLNKTEYDGVGLPMKAKDVPVGVSLLGDARNFYKVYRGNTAVEQNKLVRNS